VKQVDDSSTKIVAEKQNFDAFCYMSLKQAYGRACLLDCTRDRKPDEGKAQWPQPDTPARYTCNRAAGKSVRTAERHCSGYGRRRGPDCRTRIEDKTGTGTGSCDRGEEHAKRNA